MLLATMVLFSVTARCVGCRRPKTPAELSDRVELVSVTVPLTVLMPPPPKPAELPDSVGW